MVYAKLSGKYIGVEPGTTGVYVNRIAGGSWEELDLLKRDDGKYIVTFRSAQLVLSIQPDGRLETRPLGTDGPWEQLTIEDGVLSREGIGTHLELEGFIEVPALVRASISGFYSNVFLKGESGFLDLCRKLHGQDIKPLLQQSLDIGSNGRRNFLMTYNTAQAAGLPPFNPDDFSNYFDVLKEMLDEYAEYGLYIYGCVFPDNGLFPGWANQTQKQVDHWGKLGEIAKQYSNFWGLELTNEINSKSYNKVDQARFNPISGVICCSGSWTDDSGSPLDYPIQFELVDFHQRRDYPKSVVDSCVANYPWREKGKATALGESVGFGSKALNPNREDNPRIAKEIAGSARGTAAMLIYHTTHGAFSQLYDQTEKDCGKAWFGELKGA